MKAVSKKSTANQRKNIMLVKAHLGTITLLLTIWVYLIHLAAVAFQICEILRKFELIAVQGHPRSSILVPIKSAYATSC